MSSIESWFLHFINSVYLAMQWPGVIALMAMESAFTQRNYHAVSRLDVN
jgi:hypothetical protein